MKSEKLRKWDILKQAGIERPYNITDIRSMLGIKIPYEVAYTVEFQKNFIAGVRQCNSHAIPFVWHIEKSIDCPNCQIHQI